MEKTVPVHKKSQLLLIIVLAVAITIVVGTAIVLVNTNLLFKSKAGLNNAENDICNTVLLGSSNHGSSNEVDISAFAISTASDTNIALFAQNAADSKIYCVAKNQTGCDTLAASVKNSQGLLNAPTLVYTAGGTNSSNSNCVRTDVDTAVTTPTPTTTNSSPTNTPTPTATPTLITGGTQDAPTNTPVPTPTPTKKSVSNNQNNTLPQTGIADDLLILTLTGIGFVTISAVLYYSLFRKSFEKKLINRLKK